MHIVTSSKKPDASIDALILCAFQTEKSKKEKTGSKKREASKEQKFKLAVQGSVGSVPLDDIIRAAEREEFAARLGQSLTVHLFDAKSPSICIVLGLGSSDNMSEDTVRRAGGFALSAANHRKAKKVGFLWPQLESITSDVAMLAFLEGWQLSAYRFNAYQTENPSKVGVEELHLLGSPLKEATLASLVERSRILSESVSLARDLVNECPAVAFPESLATRAKTEAKKAGLACSVLDEKDLKKERCALILAVGAASLHTAPPRLVRLQYKPKGKSSRHVALIGKGVTFDTGGLDLKPAAGMLDMKMDMAGSATVLATLLAVAKLKPDVTVTGYMVLVENGIGSGAVHPSDIIKSRKGLTVEINNTDAEGRLILADAIDYACEKDKPDTIIDIATLTGACVVALGPNTAGLFSPDDDLASDVLKVSKSAGEDMWRLPLTDDLNEQLKSSIADMKNSGDRLGGAITAALFIKRFVPSDIRWAHLDIAGPAHSEKDHAYRPKGGSGFAVKTLVELVMQS